MSVRSFRQMAAAVPCRWPKPALVAIDCAAAAGLALLLVTWVGQARPPGASGTVGDVLVFVAAAGVAARRLAPVPALAAALTASVVSYYLGFGKDPMIAVALVLYLVATSAPAGLAIAALAVTEAGVAVTWHSPAYVPNLLPRIAATAILQGAAWALGFAVRTQRRYAAGLREQAERQVQAEADRSRRALAEERLRIARELHDMVAHTMGVIAVQAGTAGHVAAARPAEAGRALRAIEETSRSALRELRRMLTVLRDSAVGQDSADLTPAPCLRDLPGLIERTRAAGLRVELSQTGEPGDLAAGNGLAAFRIVQEALANIVRHAHADRARVLLEHGPTGLLLTVTDNGTATCGPHPPPEGHGLQGMRERAALSGGEFSAGPRPGGGYQVRAFLPAIPVAAAGARRDGS
jgi:signal transduction histidine kinase